jgi:predicted O-linked N-acetylglucosamine transferase (SPINDLY family)
MTEFLEKRFEEFKSLYDTIELNVTDSKERDINSEKFMKCINILNELINILDPKNDLEIFRISEIYYNVYYYNCIMLIQSIGGINTTKAKLTDYEKMILTNVVNRFRKCLKVDPLKEELLELYKTVFIYLSMYTDKLEEKVELLKQPLMYLPGDFQLNFNLGYGYTRINKLEEAIQCYKIAYFNLLTQEKTQFNKNFQIRCLNAIGTIYNSVQDKNTAIYYLKKALTINQNDPDINNQLGAIYTELREIDKALIYYKTGILHYKTSHISTDYDMLIASLYMNMGLVYCYECDFAEATNCYNKALKYKPKLALAYQNKLLDLNYISNMIEDPMYVSKSHKKLNDIYERVETECKNYKKKAKGAKINIGFVSGDFICHPVSFFIKKILENINKNKFKIICYSAKVLSTDFIEGCELKIIKQLSSLELYEMIQSDKIDILFDLSGHTNDNRLDTFVLKPAPIQISYCGYPGTSGIKSMDYHITDRICDSEKTQKYYQEKLIFMDKCFLNYSPMMPLNEIPALRIKDDSDKQTIVFGSFNRFNKINKDVMTVWREILIKIPNCKFIIKTKEFSSEHIRLKFLNFFREKNVEHKIIILDYSDSYVDHLNEYNLLDISLDTFPYAGTTTSCESLLMGVPVITLFDNKRYYHSQNVTSSFLKNSDLDEFITYNPKEYIEKAIYYSQKKESLDLKTYTRNKFLNGNVCNYDEFIQDFEKKITDVYTTHI